MTAIDDLAALARLRYRLEAWDHDALGNASGWCAADGCLHRVECFKGRPSHGRFCPIHQPPTGKL